MVNLAFRKRAVMVEPCQSVPVILVAIDSDDSVSNRRNVASYTPLGSVTAGRYKASEDPRFRVIVEKPSKLGGREHRILVAHHWPLFG